MNGAPLRELEAVVCTGACSAVSRAGRLSMLAPILSPLSRAFAAASSGGVVGTAVPTAT